MFNKKWMSPDRDHFCCKKDLEVGNPSANRSSKANLKQNKQHSHCLSLSR